MAYLYTAKRALGTYGGHQGYVRYSTATSNTAVTISFDDCGEYFTNTGSSTSTLSSSGTSSVTGTVGSYFSRTGTSSGIGSVSVPGGGGVYKSFSPSTASQSVSKTHSAQSVTISISWTWGGTTSTASTTVSVPALASYTVSYNGNGNTGGTVPSSQTKWYGETLTLSTSKPTRTGYTFLGWSTSSTATTATYSSGGSYTANSAATLYAVWKANTYTITYDANGGTGAPASGTKTYGVAYTIPSTVPTRTNYTFGSWLGSNDVTYQPGGTIAASVNQALTLTAQWTLNYTKPKVTDLVAVRADSSGTEDDEGTYFNISFTYTVDTALTASSIVIKGKLKTDSSYTTITTISSGLSQTGQISRTALQIGSTALGTANTYDIQIVVTDSASQTTTTTTYISPSFYTMDFLAGGHGVAIGKASTTADLFDVGMATKFNSTVTLNSAPTATLEAATKGYVDSAVDIIGMTTKTYSFAAQSAAAKGYFQVTWDSTLPNAPFSVYVHTSSISGLNGTQFSLVNATTSSAYFTYYCPVAKSGTTSLTIRAYYIK